MVVRLTYFSASPDKVEAMRKAYAEEAMPVVRSQKGNLDCRLLEPVNKSDDFISMTVWENQESADAYQSTGVYQSLVDKVKGFFSGTPVLKVYHAEGVMEHA